MRHLLDDLQLEQAERLIRLTVYRSSCREIVSFRVLNVVLSRLGRIPYFGVLLLAGLTVEGDANAIGAGTAEKADLGKGMRCWYELPRDKEGLTSGFESDMVVGAGEGLAKWK